MPAVAPSIDTFPKMAHEYFTALAKQRYGASGGDVAIFNDIFEVPHKTCLQTKMHPTSVTLIISHDRDAVCFPHERFSLECRRRFRHAAPRLSSQHRPLGDSSTHGTCHASHHAGVRYSLQLRVSTHYMRAALRAPINLFVMSQYVQRRRRLSHMLSSQSSCFHRDNRNSTISS